jgi:hypothetical protein
MAKPNPDDSIRRFYWRKEDVEVRSPLEERIRDMKTKAGKAKDDAQRNRKERSQ